MRPTRPREEAERAPDTLRRRSRKWAIVGIALLAAAVLTWSLLWPPRDCAEPSCAAQRFTVALEVDALGHIAPIDFEVSSEGRPTSLQSILRGGGIDVRLEIDQLGLPYDPASGPLDRADLYQIISAWRSRRSTAGIDAMLYALFTSALISDNGEALFGIMFDAAGREGIAVAPRTTARFFEANEPASVATLQLRTFAHELLHALNRHHTDAMQMQDGRLTLEAPTRCISNTHQRQWSLQEPPLLALSPNTIRFFQTASPRDVLPGANNRPFAIRRASPTECDDARANKVLPDSSRWQLAMRRLKGLLSFQAASAQDTVDESQPIVLPTIDVQAQPAAYPLGYPIAVRVTVNNTTEEALPIVGRLNPGYGLVVVEYRREDESEWSVLEPMIWFEPTSDEQAMLAPGSSTEETVPVYFGDGGWTFSEAGEYALRARLHTSRSTPDAVSDSITVRVGAPRTDDDRGALQALLNADGKLATEVGRLLNFGGRIGEPDDIAPLERTADRYGHTAIGGALRLTLLSQRLRRPIDAETGLRPPPDLSDARKLLEDTCTDSGVAAMTTDLLEQRATLVPANLSRRVESDRAAWDGVSPTNASIRTYSDAALQRWGPSLHFCFNEAALRPPVRATLPKLARRLQRSRPARVIVVGHADQSGTCARNDALALRRAQVVRNALVASGVRRVPIDIVSLGERRPLDFASDGRAQDLNRRVDILVEGLTPNGEGETDEHLVPRCPPRSLMNIVNHDFNDQ